jgi:pyruvate dehydrogenase E2 component (dihydrolipoamide acetyltransferase)
MAQIIGLPKLSPTMEEGVLVRWVKKEGDKVSPGDLVAEVETDKANMDFNIEDEGVLLKILVKEGETVKLGAPVAILGKAGEDVSALIAEASGGGAGKADARPDAKPDAKADAKADARPDAKADARPDAKADKKDAKAPAKAEPKQAAAPVADVKPDPGARLLASPLAKTLAIELGIDLRTVKGTGPGGRIVERDVRTASAGGEGGGPSAPGADDERATTEAEDAEDAADAADAAAKQGAGAVRTKAAEAGDKKAAPAASGSRPAAAKAPVDLGESFEDFPASNMRKRIAARLTEAKRDIPHFYLQRQIDAAPLLAFRARLNELLGGDKPKISVNDLVLKATALALRRVPECNASWTGEGIRRFHHVHVGVAVAIEDGLVTPIIRHADLKGLGTIAGEVKDLAERAKHRQLKAHEITGSTFTVSNLGMFGIERFTAILNPPEAGILAVGAVADAAVIKNGEVVAGKRMTVSMSCDHRVIDGALGARWLVAFADLLEHPESLAL